MTIDLSSMKVKLSTMSRILVVALIGISLINNTSKALSLLLITNNQDSPFYSPITLKGFCSETIGFNMTKFLSNTFMWCYKVFEKVLILSRYFSMS